MQCLPPTSVVGRASAKLNDRMAVGASQVLAWLAVPHLGCPPNGGLMRFILDESHQKGSDYITSFQSCLFIQLMLRLYRLSHFKTSCGVGSGEGGGGGGGGGGREGRGRERIQL